MTLLGASLNTFILSLRLATDHRVSGDAPARSVFRRDLGALEVAYPARLGIFRRRGIFLALSLCGSLGHGRFVRISVDLPSRPPDIHDLTGLFDVLRRIALDQHKIGQHPLPDETSLEAGKEIWRVAGKAEQGDMVFCLMSGGVSAQSVYPVEGLSLNDKITINQLLVHSGADVTEIMTVRRHLSRIKGGRLAPRMLPATIISLTVSDEKTDTMEWNTDWTSPDSTTLADAESVLTKYGLWESVSEQVRRYLSNPTPEKETPKAFIDEPLYYCMVVKTRELWEGAANRAKALGLTPFLLTTLLNGESREVGRTIASIASEIKLSGNPVKPPCALIATGETAVRIQETTRGQGGANQELAVGACLDLSSDDPIAICALDTDGTDGPTSLAGALTDGWTATRAAEKGIDIYRMLMEHDVATLLKTTGDAVITGPTGTNVNDLVVVAVL